MKKPVGRPKKDLVDKNDTLEVDKSIPISDLENFSIKALTEKNLKATENKLVLLRSEKAHYIRDKGESKYNSLIREYELEVKTLTKILNDIEARQKKDTEILQSPPKVNYIAEENAQLHIPCIVIDFQKEKQKRRYQRRQKFDFYEQLRIAS